MYTASKPLTDSTTSFFNAERLSSHAHTHTHTRTRTHSHARTYTHASARTHARTHANAHTLQNKKPGEWRKTWNINRKEINNLPDKLHILYDRQTLTRLSRQFAAKKHPQGTAERIPLGYLFPWLPLTDTFHYCYYHYYCCYYYY